MLCVSMVGGCPRAETQPPSEVPTEPAPPVQEEPADSVEAFGVALCEGRLEDAQAKLDTRAELSALQERWAAYLETWGECDGLAGTTAVMGGSHRELFFDFGGAMIPLHVSVTDEGRARKPRWMAWTPPEGIHREHFRETLTEVPGGPSPLGATLTETETPTAWVVFVHGSGPHDRDSTIGSNRVFRDLAWGLAERNIASLRYDKRSYADPQAIADDPEGAGISVVVIEDAMRAVELAHAQADGRPVYLAGHSLGGHVLPWIGTVNPKAEGLIVLAGNVSPLHELIPRQVKYLAELDGEVSLTEKANITVVNKMTAGIGDIDESSPPAELTLGAPNRFWAELNVYDPIATMKKLDRPVLFVQGERDYQVEPAQLELWRAGLGDAVDASYELLPVNHLLMVGGEGKPGPQEYEVFGHVDERVLDAMAAWIRAQAK